SSTCGKNLKLRGFFPATITVSAQHTCGRETTNQPLRTSTSKFDGGYRATLRETRLSAWPEPLLGVWETKSRQSSIGGKEQLRGMPWQGQTRELPFCCTPHPC